MKKGLLHEDNFVFVQQPLAVLWSGQWESNPPPELGKLVFYR